MRVVSERESVGESVVAACLLNTPISFYPLSSLAFDEDAFLSFLAKKCRRLNLHTLGV